MYTANFPSVNDSKNLFKNITISNLIYVHAASDPGWSFHTHSHADTLELSYVLAGKSALFCGDKYYETHPGDIIIKNAGVMHAEKSDVNNPIEQVCIGIAGIKIDDLENGCLISEGTKPLIESGSNKPLFDSMFRYILSQTVDTMSVDTTKLNSVMGTILNIIYRDYHLNMSKDEPEAKGKSIRPVREFIEKNSFR